MADRIFFNPGDSIANIHDYNEAIRKGQIFKRAKSSDELVIAKGPDDEEYAIFYANDELPKNHEKHPKEYNVEKRI